MWMSRVTLFVSVLMLMVMSVHCAKNHPESWEACRLCLETKDTRCIAEICQYNDQNTTINDEIQQASETLLAPEIHCQDEALLVFIWETENNTSYFLEYATDVHNRNYTNLTNRGFEIIRWLRSDTDYIVTLTSLKITNFDTLLLRSEPILIRTLSRHRTPLPVKRLYLDSFNLVSGKYTALIKWEPAKDKSCFYDIVWFGGGDEEIGEYSQVEIDNPLAPNEVKITNLHFGTNYSMAIRAISDSMRSRSESPEIWLNITVPTCLQTFHNLINCTPEVPEHFEVMEIFRGINHGAYPLYDIGMSWSKPNYEPDFYTAHLLNYVHNGSIQMNITGDQTTAEYTNIEIDMHYEVVLVAHSVKGASPPAVHHGFVNGTAALLAHRPGMPTELILLIVCPFIIIGLALMLAFNHFLVKKVRVNFNKELEEKPLPAVNYIVTPSSVLEPSDEWELIHEKLITKDILGEGAFGVVRRGDYYSENGSYIEVAIKMLKDKPNQEELKQFYQEIDIMKSVPSHPHLVSLIGCITQGTNQPLLVVEYCSKGDLQTYLRNIWDKLTNPLNKDNFNSSNMLEATKCASNKLYDLELVQDSDIPQPKDLISYARQIALGMEYLASLKLIHRDLAARNVLISEHNTVKISDFGLSRDVYHDKVYCKTTGGKLPLRWMALESMTHQVYTTQSDVWSFGILLWEIVTLGSTPYPGVSTGDLLSLLKDGYRMEKPSNCSEELYTIMCNCWKAAPRERPTFSELRKTLDDILETVSHYLNLNATESPDLSISRRNKINKYKNINFSEGYVIQMKGI